MVVSPGSDRRPLDGPTARYIAGFVVAVLALIALIALVVFGGRSEPGAGPMSVRAALVVQARNDASRIDVAGWFHGSPVMFCPFVPEDASPFERGCTNGAGYLMAAPERLYHAGGRPDGSHQATFESPSGPAFHVFFEDGIDFDWAIPLPPVGDSTPTPVVFVGHFDDPRSATCRDRRRCLDLFIVESVQRP